MVASSGPSVAWVRTKAIYNRRPADAVSMSGGELSEEVICQRVGNAADRGAGGRVRDDAGTVSGPFAWRYRRFVAAGIPAGLARSGGRRGGRPHAAAGRPGSGRVQGRVGHVCLDP